MASKWDDLTSEEMRALVCELIGSYEAREGLRGASACSCNKWYERCVYCRLKECLGLEDYRPPIRLLFGGMPRNPGLESTRPRP